jgi:cellulose synthase/poly-beta-1,6-N-acetylglucosamine synthase-like glycosyltransferase
MFEGQKVVVVMPAYNAEKTLTKTYKEVMDQQIVDEVIVVDDASRDDTVAVTLGLALQLEFTCTRITRGTGLIRKPVTGWRWMLVPTS